MGKNKLPIFSTTPQSDDFMKSFMAGGSYVSISCEHCGREHFTDGSAGDYEKGEIERLRQSEKENPELNLTLRKV